MTSNELFLLSNYGYVSLVNSLQGIRVSGSLTTSPAFTISGASSKQIQFYTNGCFSAFDVSGLYIKDSKSISIGTTSNNLTCSHSGTTSSISFDTLSLKPNSGSTVSATLTNSNITMNSVTATSMTITSGTISSCQAPLIINGNIISQY
jgi:hypothetical protein